MQVLVVVLQTGVSPEQVSLFIHSTHSVPFEILGEGQLVQVLVVVLQTGVSPEHSASVKQTTHLLFVVSQTDLSLGQCSLFKH